MSFPFPICAYAGKSDPYVKIKVGGNQEVKTDVKDGTLNPRWNQTFDLISYERSSEVICSVTHSKTPINARATVTAPHGS